MMDIITRKDAIKAGKSYYFTEIPCKHGHIAKRHVTGCVCYECGKEYARKLESKEKRSAWWRTDKQKEISKQRSKKYHAQHRNECLAKMNKRNPEYYKKNSERIKKNSLAYQSEHSIERTKYKREWANNKAKNDPVFKMSMVCRRMLHRALGVAGQKKYKNTRDYLPYSFEEIKNSIESQFKPGMTWNNYGEWHIDHKTPLAHFVKIGVIDPAVINRIDNLQPLWAIDNMRKGGRLLSL
jgi:hypothetical protein